MVTYPYTYMTYIVSPLAGLGGNISWRPPTYNLFLWDSLVWMIWLELCTTYSSSCTNTSSETQSQSSNSGSCCSCDSCSCGSSTGFSHLLESPGKSWILFLENSRTWKVLQKHFGPGKFWKLKLKVVESPVKISLKVMHFSSSSNGKQAAIV